MCGMRGEGDGLWGYGVLGFAAPKGVNFFTNLHCGVRGCRVVGLTGTKCVTCGEQCLFLGGDF